MVTGVQSCAAYRLFTREPSRAPAWPKDSHGHAPARAPAWLLCGGFGDIVGGSPEERPHTARYPPCSSRSCTTKLMTDPPPQQQSAAGGVGWGGGVRTPPAQQERSVCGGVGGAGISVQTSSRVSSMRSSGES